MTPVELVNLLLSVGVVGLLVPFLSDLLTHAQAPIVLKSLVTAALSAAGGAVTAVVVVPGGDWRAYLLAVGAAWGASMRLFFADWVPTLLPNFGVGGPKAADGEVVSSGE